MADLAFTDEVNPKLQQSYISLKYFMGLTKNIDAFSKYFPGFLFLSLSLLSSLFWLSLSVVWVLLLLLLSLFFFSVSNIEFFCKDQKNKCHQSIKLYLFIEWVLRIYYDKSVVMAHPEIVPQVLAALKHHPQVELCEFPVHWTEFYSEVFFYFFFKITDTCNTSCSFFFWKRFECLVVGTGTDAVSLVSFFLPLI